jgi:cell division protein FtsB
MKWKYIALSVLLVIAAINFTRTTLEIIKSSKRLDNIKDEISLLEQEKADLEKSIEYKKSDDFIEKTARNELNMAKSGESVYVISGLSKNDSAANETGSGVLTGNSVAAYQGKPSKSRSENLSMWMKLLFAR